MSAPAVEYPTEACRSCGQPVIWCVTTNANTMPVDAEPVPDGNIALETRDGRQPLARVLTVAQRFGRTGLRMSHFVTCAHAARWRRRKAAS